jgi:hypothetical protein
VKVAISDDAANTTTVPEMLGVPTAAAAELAGAALEGAAAADVAAAGADVAAAEVAPAELDEAAVFFDELHALRLRATTTVAAAMVTTADGWRFIDSPAYRGRRVAAGSESVR